MENKEILFEEYLANVSKRFKIEQDYISEDCIRYDFFYTILKLYKLDTSDLILEYPLSKLINGANTKQEIDCVIDKLSFVCECKFWKEPKSNNPQTRFEGQFLDNVLRLHEIINYKNKWLIVILHKDMIRHMDRLYNIFNKDLIDFEIKREVLESRPKTFKENVGNHEVADIKLTRLFFQEMEKGFSVAIFGLH